MIIINNVKIYYNKALVKLIEKINEKVIYLFFILFRFQSY